MPGIRDAVALLWLALAGCDAFTDAATRIAYDIEAQVPKDLDVHLVLDNYGTHKTPSVQRWFAKRPRFHVHFTPTSASWINQVERWFALLTQRQIKRGAHRSTQALRQAITSYLATYNADPRPFRWTKSADEILDSVARFCRRISDSGH